jgi:hypothetical protein
MPATFLRDALLLAMVHHAVTELEGTSLESNLIAFRKDWKRCALLRNATPSKRASRTCAAPGKFT